MAFSETREGKMEMEWIYNSKKLTELCLRDKALYKLWFIVCLDFIKMGINQTEENSV